MKDRMARVLLITRIDPLSPNSGTGVKLYHLLTCLADICNVTCLCITENDAAGRLNEARSVPETLTYLELGELQNPVKRFARHLRDVVITGRRLREGLDRVVSEAAPDLIWLEFGYIANLIPHLKKFGKPIVYCSHNSQFRLDYDIWKADRNVVNRLKMAPFLVLYLVHERLFFSMADRLLCISGEDIDYYREFILAEKISCLPYFFDDRNLRAVVPVQHDHPYICMVGSLRSYQNYDGAMYLLESLWSLIQRTDISLYLYIIGELPPVNSPEHVLLLRAGSRFNNVVFTGAVDSVIPFVKGALVNIVPLRIGSGVRTKIIESAACGTPVVSTSLGAEGLPFVNDESIIIRDDPEGFAHAVLKLVQLHTARTTLAENAYRVYQDKLSHSAGVRRLADILCDILQPVRPDLLSGLPVTSFNVRNGSGEDLI